MECWDRRSALCKYLEATTLKYTTDLTILRRTHGFGTLLLK